MFSIYFLVTLFISFSAYLLYDRFNLKKKNIYLNTIINNLNNQIVSLKKEQEKILQPSDIKNNLLRDINNLKMKIEGLEYSLISKREEYRYILSKIEHIEDYDMSSYGLYKPIFNYDTSEEYKNNIQVLNDKQKFIIQSNKSVICEMTWSVGGSKKDGEKLTKQYSKLMLKAFNGECDSNISKIRWDNYYRIEERIRKTFEDINKLGKIYSIYISNEYLELKIKELKLNYEYREKKYQEKEEQRRIQEQIREEERVQKEIEDTIKQAEKDEEQFEQALKKAKEQIENSTGKKFEELNNKISIYEQRLKDALLSKERAISRAQLTKSGFVYIISNVGAFGKEVFKIGMTRRLEPLDRVKELSGASVPFSFDVHCLIYSDNAPELERKLHISFEKKRINLINNRKEFFRISTQELRDFIKNNYSNIDFIDEVEAREYKESLLLINQTRL